MADVSQSSYGQTLEPNLPRRLPTAYRPNYRDLQYWLDEDLTSPALGDRNSASSACSNNTASRNFLYDLPKEISDIVLGYLIRWPDQPYYGKRRRWLGPLLLTAPVLQTSRRLRQQCLDLIKIRVLWLQLKFYGEWPVQALYIDRVCPSVPALIWQVLSESQAVLALDLTPAGSDNQERLALTHTITSPFTIESFAELRFHLLMGLLSLYRPIRIFKMTCSMRNPVSVDLRHTLIMKTVVPRLLLNTHGWVVSESESSTGDVSRTGIIYSQTWRFTGTPPIRDRSYDLREILNVDKTLREHGMHNEADVLLLEDTCWEFPMETPGGRVFGNISVDTRQKRKLLHCTEYRACLAYCRVASRCGPSWMIENKRYLRSSRDRWARVQDFELFGLSDIEMSEAYHAQALIWRQYAAIDDLRFFWQATRYAASTKQQTHHSFFGTSSGVPLRLIAQNARLPARQRSIDTNVANRMFFALHHQPDNLEFQQLYNETRPENWDLSCGSDFEFAENEVNRDSRAPRLKTVDLGDGTEWVGAESLYWCWYNDAIEYILRFADAGVRPQPGRISEADRLDGRMSGLAILDDEGNSRGGNEDSNGNGNGSGNEDANSGSFFVRPSMMDV